MPAKNVVRQFTPDQYLHVYNRGVEKRKIFLDDSDYQMFLYYMFIYLADPEIINHEYPKLRPHLKSANLFGRLKLLSYCLMPNHFHFLLHQTNKEAAFKLLKGLTNAYTQYFNTKYHRVGPLMQGRYKAVAITEEPYLLHLTRYIHQNPLSINFVLNALRNYVWSSYPHYLNLSGSPFLQTQEILSYFNNQNPTLTYESFVESTLENTLPEPLTLE